MSLVQELTKGVNNRKHKLTGNYKGFWECPVQPDWLIDLVAER
ncbi:MAG: Bacterial toxin of type toxin-antitoxin system, YafQ [Segetibacter sp.]|nr:Bacterial toxin of type toxin-antitoxin system, YafQ [Segetibacter sp.]